MKKSLWLIPVLALLFCAAAFAQTPAPTAAAPDPTAMREAIFSPADSPSSPGVGVIPGAIPDPEPKALCGIFPDDICVYYQCICLHSCGCGIKSFTCDSNTGQHTCTCKTC